MKKVSEIGFAMRKSENQLTKEKKKPQGYINCYIMVFKNIYLSMEVEDMALIKCPECGHEVSSEAKNCPNCGYPIAEKIDLDKTQGETLKKENEEDSIAETTLDEEHPANPETSDQPSEEQQESVKPSKKEKKPISKKVKMAIVFVIIVGCFSSGLGYYFGIKVPHDNAYQEYENTVAALNSEYADYNDAVKAYNEAIAPAAEANDKLQMSINDAQDLINAGEKPYDEATVSALHDAISSASSTMQSLPDEKDTLDEIKVTGDDLKLSRGNLEAKTAECKENISKVESDIQTIKADMADITVPDYTDAMNNISSKKNDLENSINIQKQITAPSEDFVISRLQQIDGVSAIQPVTEDHDPNGLLNKQGGYTSTVYFRYDKVPKEDIQYFDTGDTVDLGNVGGGTVETFADEESANNRYQYLLNTPFPTGIEGDCLLGTMVLRTSEYLTATEQKELTDAMVEKLTALQ